mgnify:CR=1 FL=1
MHLLRYSMWAATLGALAVSAQLVACGGDEASQGGQTPDAGTDGSSPGSVLTVSDARAKLYLGQSAKIDGPSVAPGISSAYAWKVIAAPFESTITTESLEGASTATPLFKPDLLGAYTLQVTGQKDGVSSSVVVLIEVIDAPVFWREVRFVEQGGEVLGSGLSTRVGGVHGSRERTVGCIEAPPDGGGAQAMMLLYSARIGAAVGDTWEAPPGQPSRVVFPSMTMDLASGRMKSSLTVATSESTCGSPEAKVLETVEANAPVGGDDDDDDDDVLALPDAIQNARFSPDGNRVAYLYDVGGRSRLATVGFDGSGKRDLAPFHSAGPDAGGLDPDAGTVLVPGGPGGTPLGQIVPRWKDGAHVGWMTFIGPNANTEGRDTWELHVVEDKAGATAELSMTCSLSIPSSFDFLADGTIVAAVRHPVTAPDGGVAAPMDLLVYRANPTTKRCEVVRNLTNNTSDESVARDLALSPDKTRIAFFSGTGLATVPVDGSQPPRFVPGASLGVEHGLGPRWVAGGTALTWGQQKEDQGGGFPVGSGHVVAIPAEGGAQRTVAEGSPGGRPDGDGGMITEYRLTYGFGQGCSAVPGAALTGGVGVAGAAGFVAALVARRRRHSSK